MAKIISATNVVTVELNGEEVRIIKDGLLALGSDISDELYLFFIDLLNKRF